MESGEGHGFPFLASHGFATKCTLICTFRLKGGDGVDDETEDVRGRGGSDLRCRQVFCGLILIRRKSRLEEPRDGVGLDRGDDEGCHPLALGQRVEKVAEQVVAVYKTMVLRHNRPGDVDGT